MTRKALRRFVLVAAIALTGAWLVSRDRHGVEPGLRAEIDPAPFFDAAKDAQPVDEVVKAVGAGAAEKPNIVVILADDLGYGDVASYGTKAIRTPSIDRLAAQGVRFTQFYAGSTVCAPSRSVLMTGLHTGHTRVRGNAGPENSGAQMLRDEDVTVAEVLRGAGYATALVGKWGLGMPGDQGVPNKQGFDSFYGYLSQHHAHNHFPDFLWRNEAKSPLPNVVTPVGTAGGGYATQRVKYAGDLFAEEASAFVEQHRERPFFLYLALVVPHANNERSRALGDGQEVPDYGPYADRDWHSSLKGQAAMITRMDRQIGELLALWQDEVARSRALVSAALADGGLDRLAALPWPSGEAPSLRWIVAHMIEEYARHNGHADLIREAVDGEVGE